MQTMLSASSSVYHDLVSWQNG